MSTSFSDIGNIEINQSDQAQTSISTNNINSSDSSSKAMNLNDDLHITNIQDPLVSPSPIIGATGKLHQAQKLERADLNNCVVDQLNATPEEAKDRSHKSLYKQQSNSRTPSESLCKSSKGKPTKLNRPSGSEKNSFSLSK